MKNIDISEQLYKRKYKTEVIGMSKQRKGSVGFCGGGGGQH